MAPPGAALKGDKVNINIIEHDYKWAYGATTRPRTDKLILHHTAAVQASPEQIHAVHIGNGWRGIAYNFYVRKDGSIHRGREELAQGGHTADHNATSIGICFEGNFELEDMPEAQVKGGRELIAYLRQRYGELPIFRHRDLNATACPGARFPFEEITRPEQTELSDPTVQFYRVQVGAFTKLDNAEAQLRALRQAGFEGYIFAERGNSL